MKISNKKMVIHAETLGHDFIEYNITLEEVQATNLKIVGHYFLYNNKSLKELHAPNLKDIGDFFLLSNKNIDKSKYRALEYENIE